MSRSASRSSDVSLPGSLSSAYLIVGQLDEVEGIEDHARVGQELPNSRDVVLAEITGYDGYVIRMSIMCQQPFPELSDDVAVFPFADEYYHPRVNVGDQCDVAMVLLRGGLVYPDTPQPVQIHAVEVHPDPSVDDVVEHPPGDSHLPGDHRQRFTGHLPDGDRLEPLGVGHLGLRPRHPHLGDGAAAAAPASRDFGMDVAHGLSEILVPPFAFLVIMDRQRGAAVRADARTAHIGQMDVQNLDSVVEPSLGGCYLPVIGLDTEDETHRIVQGDTLACVSFGRRDNDLLFLALRNHESEWTS